MSVFKKVKSLVAGRVEYPDLCRYAAHNLSERRLVEAELAERNLCPVRKQYLQQQLGILQLECDILVEKRDRIVGKVSGELLTEYSFII